MPAYAFFDRETFCRHPYNKLYYDSETLKKLNIKIFTPNKCNTYNKQTCRDLMIWKNDSLDQMIFRMAEK